MKLLYLVHDLADPAVHKRVTMFKDGGAQVILAGFRRADASVDSVAGCPAVDLGRTYNGGFGQRLGSVLREIGLISRHRDLFAAADVILARNLEMLAIAVRGRSLLPSPPALVYECLDIHRLLLRRDMIGMALRRVEGALSQRACALITSSPAFVSEYFSKLSCVRLPIRLVENKVYFSDSPSPPQERGELQCPPWRIGWFGAIRCRKSLEILTQLVRQSQGTIEVIIRGRPALDQFDDFYRSVSDVPGLQFLGPYQNPDDLAAIYRDVHFTWAIDMFEEGLNSSWLLPNRLYEGGLYGAVPFAAVGVEAGRFIEHLGIGLTLSEPKSDSLRRFFNQLTEDSYRAMKQAILALPSSTWTYNAQDGRDLVAYLDALRH